MTHPVVAQNGISFEKSTLSQDGGSFVKSMKIKGIFILKKKFKALATLLFCTIILC
jgi:hypothetical protein